MYCSKKFIVINVILFKFINNMFFSIFTMIKIEGYTAKEVANTMGVSESAVKVAAHRTSIKLKGILE